MKAYKAILTQLKGWNKQCLYRAKMKKDLQKTIDEEMIEINNRLGDEIDPKSTYMSLSGDTHDNR